MPITVTFEDCSESHRVKDDAIGKKFKCKGCGKLLKVEAPVPPEDDFSNFDDAELNDEDADESDESETYSRKQAPRRAKSVSRNGSGSKTGKSKSVPIGRTKVPLGIDCVYFGFLLSILVTLCLSFIGARGNPSLLRGLYLLGMGAVILTTTGKLLCLSAPPQMSGKGAIYTAALIDLASLLATVVRLFGLVPKLPAATDNLLSIAGFVCFVVFLQNLGDFLGERDLRERGSGILKLGIGLVVLWGLQVVLLVLAQARALHPLLAAVIGLPLGLVLLVAGIIAIVRYVGLLSTCRYALGNC